MIFALFCRIIHIIKNKYISPSARPTHSRSNTHAIL
nr:MAG TPA: hypothetical protein [Myoviridae sp. ct3tv2]